MNAESEPGPVLRIITPDATDEEVAALVAVFAALGSATGDAAPSPRPEWNAPHRLVRAAHPHGPGGWRGSGLPR
ncbi:MAG: acyl-CoA carboxylase epsilon subunit [Nocardioides sp.]